MGNAMTVEETFSHLTRQFGVMNIKQLNELPPTKDDSVLSETRTPCFIRLQKFPKSHFHLYFLPSFCNISAFK